MSFPVTVENEALRIEIYPQLGGKVSSVVDKADKFELLFDYAAELPTTPMYDCAYGTGWIAGWDECFPAVGAGPYPGHPYDGVRVPDHGELWGLPAVAEPAKNGITTVWHGLRFGYRFSRRLQLDGPSIIAHYSVNNLAPFDFRFVWAQHSLMSVLSPVEIDLGELTCRLSRDGAGRELQAPPFTWPNSPEGEDFSRPDKLGGKRAWKIYANDAIAGPALISYPQRGRTLRVEYDSEDGTQAYWGVWIDAGWNGHHHFAIEPTTGRYDELDKCAKDNSAGRVEASGRREWTVRWTVG
jgi:hypothetical protein